LIDSNISLVINKEKEDKLENREAKIHNTILLIQLS
jgi:hypothetical protein